MSARPRLLDNAASNLGRTMPPRLSIDANRFTLVDSTGNEKLIQSLALDVVFIDLNPKVSKLYFGKEYNPNDTGDIPKCWSDNGVAPSSQADQPQAQTCLMCPHNVIGSAISKFTGAKIKACVDMKKLAFVVPGDEQNMIYLFTLKPGSFKNWTSYVNWLKTQKFAGGNAPDLPDVVTRLSFESQGVLKFEPAAAVPGNKALEAQLEAAWARGVSGSITGQDDVPISGQLGAPAQPAQQLPPPVAPVLHNPMQTQTPAAPVAQKRRGPKPKNAQPAPAPAAAPFQFPQTTPQPAPSPVVPPAQAFAPAPVQAADPNALEIPPFLQRNPAPAPAAPTPSFGMATSSPASPEMQAAIEQAFSLPTK